jgi:predicted transcriptional regulator
MNYNKEIKKLGITKTMIAKKIGISNVLLSYYLNGVRKIPIHIEEKLKDLIQRYKMVL